MVAVMPNESLPLIILREKGAPFIFFSNPRWSILVFSGVSQPFAETHFMSRPRLTLDTIRVATPCRASWEEMEGDGRVRFCSACRRNVYNLSNMTRPEAEDLVRQSEGRTCVRFYQREDGTIPIIVLDFTRGRLYVCR